MSSKNRMVKLFLNQILLKPHHTLFLLKTTLFYIWWKFGGKIGELNEVLISINKSDIIIKNKEMEADLCAIK